MVKLLMLERVSSIRTLHMASDNLVTTFPSPLSCGYAAQEFSEWHQCQILEVVSHYRPEGKEEVFNIMNALEDRMTSTNSALVLGVIKVFLFLTITMPATHQQVPIQHPFHIQHCQDEEIGI